jgi:hypothetical protein
MERIAEPLLPRSRRQARISIPLVMLGALVVFGLGVLWTFDRKGALAGWAFAMLYGVSLAAVCAYAVQVWRGDLSHLDEERLS